METPHSGPSSPSSALVAKDGTSPTTSVSTLDWSPGELPDSYCSKRRVSVSNDAPVTPKRPRLNDGIAGVDSPPGAPRRGTGGFHSNCARPSLLPSPLPDDRPRPPMGLFGQRASRRNAVARLMPFLWSEDCSEEDEWLYNEIAHWYNQFRLQMWSPVASMMGIRWEQVEELAWRIGKVEIDRRIRAQ